MERKIYRNMCGLAFLTIILTSVITLWTSYDLLTTQVQERLRTEAAIVAKSLDSSSQRENLIKSFGLGSSSSRVTLVSPDGQVLYDNHADAKTMENHSDRIEIAQAMKSGTGQAVRFSQTFGEKTFYYAVRLVNGCVVRLSATTSTVYAIFIKLLPYLFLMGAAVFILCALLAYRLTRKIVEPIYSINFEEPQDDLEYDELAPLLLKIAEQNRLIKVQMEALTAEQDTIRTIIDNMHEGLILLDRNNKILAVNKSALRLLEAFPKSYHGKNLWVLTRNLTLGTRVEEALEGKHSDGVFQMNQKDYYYFASPVDGKDQIDGVVLFLLEVTEDQVAERLRQEFSANVSHELKTPLTSIFGYAEMIESGMAKDMDIKSFAGKIKAEASRMVSLINDIIKLSQLDEAKGDKPFKPVNLLLVARDVAKQLQQQALKHQITISVEGQEAVIEAEETMLQELIYNLLENSIKYNKPGGKVFIEVSQADGDKVKLTVRDTGIGIPAEQQDRVFERFYRVDKSHSKKIGGTGLGLAIVKHVAQYHNGSLSLESRENEGTTVTVVF